ncbi:shikimate dehydrogenase [Kiloniella sp. b19]|uniref:shikimate dehydrogenase n=1 Tax=Kiloniella sp. GXU_MW_B19 TaxID=3141326 RepID=UPI0031E1FE39
MTDSPDKKDTLLSGKAALAGVIGFPVSHSKSPRLHGYWLRAYGIDGAYLPLSVAPDDLGTAVKGLQAAGFRGANVTVPHKEAVMAFCDEIDPLAQRIGAVNTLVFREDGKIHGSNTDGIGFLENLRQGSSLDFHGLRVGVLGAGGAARGILVALQHAGVSQIKLTNRTASRAEKLAEDLNNSRENAEAGLITVIDWDQKDRVLENCDLLINTTSLGMEGQPPLDLDFSALPENAVVTDIVYAPLITPLLAAAREKGYRIVDGLGMLLHQACPGFRAWFGREPEVTEALRRTVLGGETADREV